MAEAGIGLAASLISLATIFKACIDCFELYKAAEDCEESLKTILVELDCEKERLLIWAEAIGLVQLESGRRHPDIEKHEKVVKAALEQILNLFNDATKLKERYGVQVFDYSNAIATATTDPVSRNLATMFTIGYKRFTSRLNPFDSNTQSLAMKIKWAIRDRARFMGLIVTLKGFIDRLFQIIPISREVQDSMAEVDIFSIMELSQLRLVETACSESYKVWSDIASVAIDRTERETIDQRTHRNDEEQNLHTSSFFSDAKNARTTAPKIICQEGWYDSYACSCSKFFVSVERCDSFAMPPPCVDQEFHTFSTDYPSYLTERYDNWNLGRRLMMEIDVTGFMNETLNLLSKRYENNLAEIGSIAHIRIYVAPCKRQISTALNICRNTRIHRYIGNRYLGIYIRIDDRLSASCCFTSAVFERLKSLRSQLDKVPENYDYIDRLWLEQRLYEINDEIDRDPITLETQLSDGLRCVYDCTGLSKPLAAILLIGESDLINEVINTKPFEASPRVPRPNEFFRAKRTFIYGKPTQWKRIFLGTIDVNPKHEKAEAPVPPLSPPASQSSLKREAETELGDDSHAKRAKPLSEHEYECLYD